VVEAAVGAGARDASHFPDAHRVWQVLEAVPDPEIPVLSIVDLGIVRFVRWSDEGPVRVGLTPTYSGCPATEVIRRAVAQALDEAGCRDAVVEEVISPPWTTDWITEAGRGKLAAFGIAPPTPAQAAACPRCGSQETQRISEFGSTPCKAHYRCNACLEPFDRFKCL
jgi:ring-1,2-phenylacetyl-CoA epoxidase subunit PaaD